MKRATDKYFYYGRNGVGKPQEKADYGDMYYVAQDILVLSELVEGFVAVGVTNPLTRGNIFVGNASGVATSVAMSGDATIVDTGAVTVVGILGNTIPADAVGALTNDGAGNLTWAASGGLITAIGNTATVLLTNTAGTLTADFASMNVSQFLNDVPYLITEVDPVFTAWLALPPNISIFNNDVPYLTAATIPLNTNEIAFGDAANIMTSSSNLTWIEASRDFNITGTIGLTVNNSANVFYAAQGNVGFWFTGAASTGLLAHQGFGIDFDAGKNLYTVGDVGITNNTHIEVDDVAQTIELTSVNTITASNLAGVGTRMVTASAAGVLSTSAIPGGMTNPMTTLGDIIYEDAVPAPARLAGNTNADRRVLSQTGTGAISAAPIWIRFDASDILSGTIAAARMPALTGDVTTTVGTVATTIANDAVTYAKMQDVSATSRVLGRITAGAGDTEELTPANIETILGITKIIKSANTTDATNVLVDTASMTVPVVANTNYIFYLNGRCGSTAANGGNISMVCPAGCTIEFQMFGNNSSISTMRGNTGSVSGDLSGVLANAAGFTTAEWRITGSIQVGATAGDLKMQQKSISSNNFTIYAGAVMKVERMN